MMVCAKTNSMHFHEKKSFNTNAFNTLKFINYSMMFFLFPHMMSRDIFGPLFVASLDAKTLYKSVFFARHVR